MKSLEEFGGAQGTQDPTRWADMPQESLGAASKFLVSPPPIKALPSEVAKRVRANVLQGPTSSVSLRDADSLLVRRAATLKLGGVAVGAALFGAAAMTALSAARDPGPLQVVVAPPSRIAGDDESHLVQRSSHIGARESAGHEEVQAPATARREATDQTSPLEANNRQLGAGERDQIFEDPASEKSIEAATGDQNANRQRQNGQTATTGTTNRAEPSLAGLDEQRQDRSFTASALRESDTNRGNVRSKAGSDSALGNDGAAQDADGDFELLTQPDAHERPVVRPQFRRVTTTRRPTPRVTLTSLEEETLLLENARSKLGRAPEAALGLALDHQTRFRQGQLLEQRRMIHLEALLRLGRDDEAKKLAASIGSSIYQARARALLIRYGIVVE